MVNKPPALIVEEHLEKFTVFVEAWRGSVCGFVAWNWDSCDWDGLFWILKHDSLLDVSQKEVYKIVVVYIDIHIL